MKIKKGLSQSVNALGNGGRVAKTQAAKKTKPSNEGFIVTTDNLRLLHLVLVPWYWYLGIRTDASFSYLSGLLITDLLVVDLLILG